MAYQCPRCGADVQRGSNSGAAIAGGLVGALLYSAFGSFECKKCGKIPSEEFPPEVRQQMVLGSIGLMVGAIVLLAAVIALLIWLER
jgi:hypothetical protein